MKTPEEIRQIGKLIVELEGDDGGMGSLCGMDLKRPNKQMAVVWSWGGGWDHVSVSWANRCPTWEEMCAVKAMFFQPDEVVVEYHPAESEYVNQHPYCLHLWRPQKEALPTPPAWMVGIRKGESLRDVVRNSKREMGNMENGAVAIGRVR